MSLPWILKVLRKIWLPRKLGSLDALFGKHLSEKGIKWIQTAAGPVWKLDLRNPTHRWIVYADYEGPGFVPWAKKWVKEDSVVVDSGANIGQVLLYLAPRIRTGKYIAVEPNHVAKEWLEECLREYPEWPVICEGFGLGSQPGKASLVGTNVENSVGSHGALQAGGGEIEVRTLDDYCQQNKIHRIDLWKLDMEGGEEAALLGADKMMRRKAIRSLVLETDDTRFERDINLMQSFSYQAMKWNGAKLKTVKKGFYGNILFQPT